MIKSIIYLITLKIAFSSNYGLLLNNINSKKKYKNGLNTPIYFNDTSCYYFVDFDNINDVFYDNVKNLYLVEIPVSEKLIIKNITTFNEHDITIYCSNMIIMKENLKNKNKERDFEDMLEIIYYLTPEYLEKFYVEKYNETTCDFEYFEAGLSICYKNKINLSICDNFNFITTLFSKNEVYYKYYINSLQWIMNNIVVSHCSYSSSNYCSYPFYPCSYDIHPSGEINVINLLNKLKINKQSSFNKKILSILNLAIHDINFYNYFNDFLKNNVIYNEYSSISSNNISP